MMSRLKNKGNNIVEISQSKWFPQETLRRSFLKSLSEDFLFFFAEIFDEIRPHAPKFDLAHIARFKLFLV